MNRRWGWVVTAVAMLAAGAGYADNLPAGSPKPKAVTLHVFSRVFGNFHDKVSVPLRQEFRVGDTEYTARIVDWVPDFAMDLKNRKIFSRGPEPKNPAFRIVVRKNGAPQDTVWAFVNMPPHFARKSLLAFIATQIEFLDHPPIVSEDSLALKIMNREKESPR
jgi:hypothetical protein